MQSLPARMSRSLFFFNDTATTEIYTLSLHDALPISISLYPPFIPLKSAFTEQFNLASFFWLRYSSYGDRKSTRLNSSHSQISYAVFCLKKKRISPGPILQWLSPDIPSDDTIAMGRSL